MSWIDIGLLVFILIICFIIVVLMFMSLTNLGSSRAGIIDDQVADTAYSWGTWATLSMVISISLILSLIILYWYEVSGQLSIKILLIVSFVLLIISGGFAISSYNTINDINNPDEDINSASSLILYAAILSFVAAAFVAIVFIIDIIRPDEDVNIDQYSMILQLPDQKIDKILELTQPQIIIEPVNTFNPNLS